MSIDIDCECGTAIEVDEYIILFNKDYTPIEIVCPDCGRKYGLYIHIEFVDEEEA